MNALRLSTTRMSVRLLGNSKAGAGVYTPIKRPAWELDLWRTRSVITCSLKEAEDTLLALDVCGRLVRTHAERA
jgi:hypothetical protein